jgi:hypothetical protein
VHSHPPPPPSPPPPPRRCIPVLLNFYIKSCKFLIRTQILEIICVRINVTLKKIFLLAYESKMFPLKTLQSALYLLNARRSQVIRSGWFLQNCWLVQVKPGGTARTDCKYWQVRSRQPIFAGKTLKHLKLGEVEGYRAAIARGRQLKQIDRQIEKLQQQLARLTPTANSSTTASKSLSIPCQALETPMQTTGEFGQQNREKTLQSGEFTSLAEQERCVKEILAKSQTLRNSLRKSTALNLRLRAEFINIYEDSDFEKYWPNIKANVFKNEC